MLGHLVICVSSVGKSHGLVLRGHRCCLVLFERMAEKTDLDKLAEEELLREAQRGASRAAVGGALAWQKCPLQPTNKRFLVNMIQYTVNANKLKQQRQIKKYEITKHHSGHSVQKTNPSHSSRRNRKRTRDDTCNVQDDGQKKETHKRKASKKRDS